MYAVVYRFTIREGADQQFRAGWRALTQKIYSECGSLGSRLHRVDDTTFVAYAQWPSEETFHLAAQMMDSFSGGTNWDETVDLQTEIMFTMVMTDDMLKTAPFQRVEQ